MFEPAVLGRASRGTSDESGRWTTHLPRTAGAEGQAGGGEAAALEVVERSCPLQPGVTGQVLRGAPQTERDTVATRAVRITESVPVARHPIVEGWIQTSGVGFVTAQCRAATAFLSRIYRDHADGLARPAPSTQSPDQHFCVHTRSLKTLRHHNHRPFKAAAPVRIRLGVLAEGPFGDRTVDLSRDSNLGRISTEHAPQRRSPSSLCQTGAQAPRFRRSGGHLAGCRSPRC